MLIRKQIQQAAAALDWFIDRAVAVFSRSLIPLSPNSDIVIKRLMIIWLRCLLQGTVQVKVGLGLGLSFRFSRCFACS